MHVIDCWKSMTTTIDDALTSANRLQNQRLSYNSGYYWLFTADNDQILLAEPLFPVYKFTELHADTHAQTSENGEYETEGCKTGNFYI